jgi:rubrerythrin
VNRLTRRALLGAGTAVALAGLPLLTSFVEAAQDADPADLTRLGSALALEQAAIKAYNDGAATGLLSKPLLAVASGFIADHTAHRDALIAAIRAGGGLPPAASAKLAYPRLKTETDVLRFALAVEEKAANAYLALIPAFADRKLAGFAASILGVETTHVALLSNALGQPGPYPGGFMPIPAGEEH